MNRKRLDQLVVMGGMAESREKAQRLIRAGRVRVADQVASKPGHLYPEDTELVLESEDPFVGRGGEKLQGAFDHFALDVSGKVCLDIGASTGGFTDCLLQHGARRVYAVDVGKGQLHWKLRNDPRVVPMEGVNARYLEPDRFDPRPAFCCIDVSFISLTKILPAATHVLEHGSGIVTLIKPQFEAGRDQVGRGGVVRDPEIHKEVIQRIRNFGVNNLGLEWRDVIPSPLKGPKGNTEFLACWTTR